MHRKSSLVIFSLIALALSFPSIAQERGSDDWDESWETNNENHFHGFVELGLSQWIKSDNLSEAALEEIRWRIENRYSSEQATLNIKTDLYFDKSLLNSNRQLSGRLREGNIEFTLAENFDFKIGRQILTWGTGDLIFINDLFPKDWQSFFNGREDEYLKAPSDAIKSSWFGKHLNIDLILTPRFDSDRYLTGERFSFWLPPIQNIAQPRPIINAQEPNNKDWEAALRLYGKVTNKEWAFYGYRGFYKSPVGADLLGRPRFPRLNVIGASLRAPIGKGIANIELGHYHSIEDTHGTNPLIPNSQWRFLTGYETEIAKNLTAAFQAYFEVTRHHTSLLSNSPSPQTERSRVYKMLTTRLTYLTLQQRLMHSLFLFYSPDESDWHLRIKSRYRFNDHWSLAAGVYWFEGEKDFTFWSQLQENNSVWLRLRYNY